MKGLRERGSVLVIVLWIAIGLVSLSVYFGHAMMLEYRTSDNSYAGLKADQVADGARRFAQAQDLEERLLPTGSASANGIRGLHGYASLAHATAAASASAV